MRIGHLASISGLSVDTIRFYERAGLLEKPARSESGYRQYGTQDVDAVLFIKRVQELGFSLKEIRELVVLQATKADCCPDVSSLLKNKVAEVRVKRRQLSRLEKDLTASLRKCEQRLKGSSRRHAKCPVLARLHDAAKVTP